MDLYHALNRGVDKRIIFEDDQDRARFVHDMFIFNNVASANHTSRNQMADLRSRPFGKKSYSSDLLKSSGGLVDIHGWCLMSNHYHLLLSEKVEGGLVQFLRKLNVGYAKYFNERYKRSGTLFQGRTKKLLIDNDAYFLHILNYIHLNPLDMLEDSKEWRSGVVNNADTALEHLRNYRWSSYCDYIGTKNFPSILTTSLFNDVFEGKYKESFEKYLKDIDTSISQQYQLEK